MYLVRHIARIPPDRKVRQGLAHVCQDGRARPGPADLKCKVAEGEAGEGIGRRCKRAGVDKRPCDGAECTRAL